MKPWKHWLPPTLAAAAGLLATTGAHADDTLYSFGPDGDGIGRVFTPVQLASPGVTLGDGTVAFNGGLAWSSADNAMYAIENDSNGQSFLTSFSPSAPASLSAPVALGQGFLGGLAFDTVAAQLYAIGSDAFGESTFYSVGPSGAVALGSLGTGFYGGLTYDTADHDFYAIGADDSFEPRRVSRIDVSGGAPVVTTVFDLGDGSVGFLGGIAWDAANARFVTIGSDSVGDSSLYSFSLGGADTLADLGSVGPGFVDAGLAFSSATPVVPSIPEPSTAVLLLVGALSLSAACHRAHPRSDVKPTGADQ
jgi:hypothetical protein